MATCDFDIYLQYRTLSVRDFGQILVTTEKLYRAVYGIMADVWIAPANTLQNERSVASFALVSQRLKFHPEDRLEIAYIGTGNSIKYRIRAGWCPNIDTDNGDLVIELPKGAAAVLVAGMLVAALFSYSTLQVKAILEIIKTHNEIRLQENQKKIIEREIEEFERKLRGVPPSVEDEIDRRLRKLGSLAIRNPEILSVDAWPGIEG